MNYKKEIATIFIILCKLTWAFSQNTENSGGGEFVYTTDIQCIGPADYARISSMLDQNIKNLHTNNLLPASDRSQIVKFAFPLKKSENLNWNNFYGISGFVDQDAGNGIKDFNCGQRTYDGHNGVDYFTWPFQWYLLENDLIYIVAAADGILIGKDDGNSSYSCDWNGNQNWNAVYIRHADGSVAFYGHMKKNSLTGKPVGSTIKQGEYLGVVGSSGRSSGPHLHFEIYKSQPFTRVNLIEPHEGNCNLLNNNNWWESQELYQKPTINTIITHDDVIELGCPTEKEKTYFQNEFKPGDRVYFSRFYKDQKKGTSSFQKVYKPDNSIWVQWQANFNDDYNASWWYNFYTLPANAETGEWRYEVTYLGDTMQHIFKVNTQSFSNNTDQAEFGIFPNPAGDWISIKTGDNIASYKKVITITDVKGFVLQKINSNEAEVEINIEDLAPGVYFIGVLTTSGKSVQRFIKNH